MGEGREESRYYHINTWEKEGKNRGLLLSNACEGPRPLSLAHMAATGFRVLQKYGCIRPLSGVKGY